ncbi:MAG: DUF5698 domain-containing protein [Candidatus Aminicenantes bacterium]|jgi:uncharacterized protein YebE (UPF0316 family)
MNIDTVTNSFVYLWIILPFLIFLARIIDVTLQTMRIVFISKGLKYLAPIVGFFEVIIWLLAMRAIVENLDNFACFIAYGAGFAMGSYIGMLLDRKLALGRAILRIITQKDATRLIEHLYSKGYGLTHLNAYGHRGKVKIIFMVIKKQMIPDLAAEIGRFNPRAFYSLEDVQYVSAGIFPSQASHFASQAKRRLYGFWRKSK